MSPRQRWLSHFEDEVMKRRNSNALDRFEKCAGISAEDLLKKTRKQMRSGDPRAVEKAFQKFYDDMKRRHLTHDSRMQWISVIRGFFRANWVRLPPLLLKKSDVEPGYKPHGVPFNQLDVKRMIRRLAKASKSGPWIVRRNMALIAFLAQTGQKESVLAGITWERVREGNRIARRHGYPSHALVEIGPEFPRNLRRHRFVVGPNTMRLMQRLPRPHVGKVFKTAKGKYKISDRTIERIVVGVAEECGLQGENKREYRGWKANPVTPEVFRKYWKLQMRSGGVEDRDLLNYMMGLRKSASDEWSDDHLLRKYTKADRKLGVL